MRSLEMPRLNPLIIVIAVVLVGLFVLGVATDDRPIMAVAMGGVVFAGVGWWVVS